MSSSQDHSGDTGKRQHVTVEQVSGGWSAGSRVCYEYTTTALQVAAASGIKRRDLVAINRVQSVGERDPPAVFAVHCLGRAGDRVAKGRRSHGQSAGAIMSSASRRYQYTKPKAVSSSVLPLRRPLAPSDKRWQLVGVPGH